MQVSNAIITVAVEFNIALIVGAVILFVHARKLKSLVRRQQDKLLELLRDQPPAQPPQGMPSRTPTQNYKLYLNKEIEATSAQFNLLSPDQDIGTELPGDMPLFQRILALRYAFLRAEELGTTEDTGTTEYWSIFQQTLEPLLNTPSDREQELLTELDVSKKRIENLEKFKRLFFDMEKQWATAQAHAQDYYSQLLAMSDGVEDREGFNEILERYHTVYDEIHQNVIHITQNPDTVTEHKTIHITRQDPRAAEEIMKLRNVAADQHRVINQLQRKLIEAKTSEEKELVIQELQQQLQRQTRFVQESETCVQLLEDELSKAQEELSLKEKALDETLALGEENERIKSTLHSFTLESKDMMSSINELEKENDSLKHNLRATPAPTSNNVNEEALADIKKMQSEFMSLKKQYAELEEKYLDLKLGS